MNSLVATRWGAGIAGAVCIVCAVVGCGSQTVEGSPTAATQSGQPSFDPCTLPDEALVAAGVDPESEDPDFFGVRKLGWNLCKWSAGWYVLGVAATKVPIEAVRENPRNTAITPVSVGARDAFTYREATPDSHEYCDVAYQSTDGPVIIRAEIDGWESQADPCAVAVSSAQALDPFIPQ
ncbi:MAG TPA: DUF3558 family protein [Aldersonia sp.]